MLRKRIKPANIEVVYNLITILFLEFSPPNTSSIKSTNKKSCIE